MIKTHKEAWTVWTREQVDIVKKNYTTMPQNDLKALLPDKTWNAIVRQAALNGIKRQQWDRPSQDWSIEHLDILRRYYAIESSEWLSEKLDRVWPTIQTKASELGLKRKRLDAWTNMEKLELRNLRAKGLKLEEIVTAIGKTYQAVVRQVRLLGLVDGGTNLRQNTKFDYRTWNKNDDDLLTLLYVTDKCELQDISERTNRSESSIRNRLTTLGLTRTASLEWTQEDDAYLVQHYPIASQEQIEQYIGRAWTAIQKRATNVLKLQRKGLVKQGQWTKQEQELLIKLSKEKASPEEIREALPNRSWQAISYQAVRRLKIPLSQPRIWTPEEDELLKKHYHNMEMVKLLEKLPRHSVSGVYTRANGLELERKKIRYYREELMKHFLDLLLPDEQKHDNLRPDFLGGLEYDRYYPNLKLAFEYNGIQHYEPMSDTEEAAINFVKQQERDQRKVELSKLHGIKLVTIKYDQELTLDLIKGFLV